MFHGLFLEIHSSKSHWTVQQKASLNNIVHSTNRRLNRQTAKTRTPLFFGSSEKSSIHPYFMTYSLLKICNYKVQLNLNLKHVTLNVKIFSHIPFLICKDNYMVILANKTCSWFNISVQIHSPNLIPTHKPYPIPLTYP